MKIMRGLSVIMVSLALLAGLGPVCAPAQTASLVSVSGGYDTAGTGSVSCVFSYPAGRQMLSLLWRVAFPSNWVLDSVSGDGDPTKIQSDIVLTGTVTGTPVRISCAYHVPEGTVTTGRVSATAEYMLNAMANPVSVSALPNPLSVVPVRQLIVSTPHGQPVPLVGTNMIPYGITVRASVAPVVAAGYTQYVCRGWSGTGSVPAIGYTSSNTFSLADDSRLAWQWLTNYWLQANAQVGGGVSPVSGWYVNGTNFTVLATPVNGYVFQQWEGTGLPGGVATNNPLAVSMTAAITLTARFMSLGLLVPVLPVGVSAVALTTNVIQVSWVDVATNEAGYKIERALGLAGSWEQVGVTATGATNFIDGALQAATLYRYRVRAFSAYGNSAYSVTTQATTPSPDPVGNFLLQVLATNLVFNGATKTLPEEVDAGALVGGRLDLRLGGPSGNGAIERVALGFRDFDGHAVGPCVEITDLYGVPGYPPVLRADVPVPSGLTVPAGTNLLWIEASITINDPCEIFRNEIRSMADALKTCLGVVGGKPVVTRQVNLVGGVAVVGGAVQIPVLVGAQGDENAMGFSIAYPPGQLSLDHVELASGAASAWLDVNTAVSGEAGVVLALPSGQTFGAGTRQVLTLTFTGAGTGLATVAFSDSPVSRELVSTDANPLPAAWSNTTIQVNSSYEGDVYPVGTSDARVTTEDYLLVSQFASKRKTPSSAAEFQRADCAPRATRGDGVISVADVVQVGRYRDGLDPLQLAGGPTTSGLVKTALSAGSIRLEEAGCELNALDASFIRGQTNNVRITLSLPGSVRVVGFSLLFEPASLTYLESSLSGVGTNATLVPNVDRLSEGRIGFVLSTADDTHAFPAGTNALLSVCFSAVPVGGVATTSVALVSDPTACAVSDSDSTEVIPVTHDSRVMLTPPYIPPEVPESPSWTSVESMGTSEVYLAWAQPAGPVDGIAIERKNNEGIWTEVGEVPSGTCFRVDSSLLPGTVYSYLLRARNASGYSPYGQITNVVTWTHQQAWRQVAFGNIENSGLGADDGDPDGDGLPNKLEYAMGTNPREADKMPLTPAIRVLFGAERFYTMSYSMAEPARPGVSFGVERSTDLVGGVWSSGTAPVEDTVTGSVRTVTVRSLNPLESVKQEFFRLNTSP